MKALTDRQREVFDFLRDYYHEQGFPPSMQEVGDHFGFTSAAAKCYFHVLQKKGVISYEPYKPRSLRFVKDYFSLKVHISSGCFRVGDDLIVCSVARPVAGEGVVVEKDGVLRIEAFCGQKPIVGKVIGLCREV